MIPDATSKISRPATPWMVLALFVFTFALYSPSLQYGLVHIYDTIYIANNTSILDGLTWDGIRAAFSPDNTTATMYMPLLWISYMMDVDFLGASAERPWGFHLTNVLLHALNASLLGLLLLLIGRNPWVAFGVAVFWAIHPLRVESVAWISERKDVLSGLFALLCIAAYFKAGSSTRDLRPSKPWTLASLLFFALGLLTKPALVPLPLVLLLLDVWPLKRASFERVSLRKSLPRLLIEKIPFFILAGLASLGTIATHRVVTGEIPTGLLARLQSIPLSYGFYLLKTMWPQDLTVLYPHWPTWLTPAQAMAYALLAILLLAGLTLAAWRTRHRAPGLLVGWVWFLVMLFPVSGVIPIPTNDVADRFSYVPAMGLSLALLACWPSDITRLTNRVGRRLVAVTGVFVLVALALLTTRQLPAWRNAETLNARILEVFPSHATALETRAGNLMRSTGDFREAKRLLTKALEADPHHWKTHLAKAQCLWALEGPAAARELLQTTPPPTSRHVLSQWHRDLARYALMLGLHQEAAHHAEQAMALLAPIDLSRTPLALLAMTAAYEMGDPARALTYARRFPPFAGKTSLELQDLLPHYIFQWIAGYRSDTVQYFQRLVEAYPDRIDYLNNLVWGLATADWSPVDAHEILVMAERLAAMAPAPHPGILDTLAAAQANAGDFEGAVQTMQKALALFPPSTDAELLLFKERLAYRLALYEQRRPYREDAFIRLFVATVGDLGRISEPTAE